MSKRFAPRSRFRQLWIAAAAGAALMPAACADEEVRRFTFSWPFAAGGSMQPRGGTTTGPGVELLEGASEAWSALREPGLDDFERDRRAILAMAGGYRTTFDFLETVGFTPDFQPAAPYQSWATEYVFVLEDVGDRISLQHVIVMLFVGPDGDVQGPFVQKHWRQDWEYEDRSLHVYSGDRRWRRVELDEEAVRGSWSQAVYQVDDSPRYEALGEWVHEQNYSAWTSDETWRPLPRRESSVRDDYDVLIGTNRHTITPTGWVHEENNLKTQLDQGGGSAAFLARELGLNRYERVVDFDFSAADRYWSSTAPFWSDVRAAWREIYADQDAFQLASQVEGRALFERMFEYAERLASGAAYNAEDSQAFVRETLARYVEPR